MSNLNLFLNPRQIFLISYIDLNGKARLPIYELAPQFIHFLENEAATKITQVIVHNISRHLTNIMKKINLRQLVEDQINTFDLLTLKS